MLNKILLWLLEKKLPSITKMLLGLFTVDAIVAKVEPFLGQLLMRLPQVYRAQLKELLSKIGQIFIELSD